MMTSLVSVPRCINGGISFINCPHGQERFQRVKRSGSTDRGAVTRRYDAADRVVHSTDANGSWASYEYDVAGRIVRQTLIDPRAPIGQRQSVTTWTYTGALLTGIDHPSQHERYTHDAAGRVTTKTVTLSPTGGKAVTSVTQYAYDRSGRLSGISLPDGSMLEYRRNGQGQVVALERHRIRTSWLRWLEAPEVIVKDLERDIVGLRSASYGNGVRARYQRSAHGPFRRNDAGPVRPDRRLSSRCGTCASGWTRRPRQRRHCRARSGTCATRTPCSITSICWTLRATCSCR